MGVLKDLWLNEIAPSATNLNEFTIEILELWKKARLIEEKLSIMLDEEELGLLWELKNTQFLAGEMLKYNAFKQGFKKGREIAKDLEDIEESDDLKLINEEIKRLTEALETKNK